MAKDKDILLNSDIDIIFAGQDLVIGDSTAQNQYLILASQKGEWKENPFVGAGIEDMTNDEDTVYWKHRISEELKRDGMTVMGITVKDNQININAEYR